MELPLPHVLELRVGDRVQIPGQVGLWRLTGLDERPGVMRARFTLAGGGSLTMSRGARLSAGLEDSVTVVTAGSGRYLSDLLPSEQVRSGTAQHEGSMPNVAMRYAGATARADSQ